MNWSVIHDNNRPWTGEWGAEWKKLKFDEIFEQFLRKRPVLNIPSEETMDGICRKN